MYVDTYFYNEKGDAHEIELNSQLDMVTLHPLSSGLDVGHWGERLPQQ